MRLEDIYQGNFPSQHSLFWNKGVWEVVKKLKSDRERRQTLGFFFQECAMRKSGSLARVAFNKMESKIPQDLPHIIGRDVFLKMYALAEEVKISFFLKFWKNFQEIETSTLPPIFVGETLDAGFYFDVDATPPAFLPKFSSSFRKKIDEPLLKKIQSDLIRVADIKEREKRIFLTLAILSHGACYREIEGKVLKIPSLREESSLISYTFQHHLIWEGVKTVSAFPILGDEEERGIYLCQGTEIWPSQPSSLGSIFANLCKEGAATEPYAHSWRGIHKHLKNLTRKHLPFVAGHSMGGALATQIALYSHPLIEKAYSFNAPSPENRDFEFYQNLSEEAKSKLLVFGSIDDLPFWRIGSTLTGKVTVFLGERRWRYRPLKKWEVFTIIPAILKAIVNMINALPAHQRIVPLLRTYIYFTLSPEEIHLENTERQSRFDHIDFFPKLYRPAKRLLHFVRKYFGWQLYDEYLRNQIEILELHEADLQESQKENPSPDIERELAALQKQKEFFLNQLKRK